MSVCVWIDKGDGTYWFVGDFPLALALLLLLLLSTRLSLNWSSAITPLAAFASTVVYVVVHPNRGEREGERDEGEVEGGEGNFKVDF